MRRAPDVVSLVAGAGAIAFGAVLLADSAGGLHLTFAWLAPLVCAVRGRDPAGERALAPRLAGP